MASRRDRRRARRRGLTPRADAVRARGFEVDLPDGKLPLKQERPYMPLGTLGRALVYPAGPDDVADRNVSAALVAVGLEQLADQLDAIDDWALRLSAASSSGSHSRVFRS